MPSQRQRNRRKTEKALAAIEAEAFRAEKRAEREKKRRQESPSAEMIGSQGEEAEPMERLPDDGPSDDVNKDGVVSQVEWKAVKERLDRQEEFNLKLSDKLDVLIAAGNNKASTSRKSTSKMSSGESTSSLSSDTSRSSSTSSRSTSPVFKLSKTQKKARRERKLLLSPKYYFHDLDNNNNKPLSYEKTMVMNFKLFEQLSKRGIETRGLIKHMATLAVKAETRQYRSEALVQYDLAVKSRVVEEGWKAFGKIDNDEFLACFTAEKMRPTSDRRSSANGKSSTFKPGVCHNYNKMSGCSYNRCSYKHICNRCDQLGHGQSSCPNTVSKKE